MQIEVFLAFTASEAEAKDVDHNCLFISDVSFFFRWNCKCINRDRYSDVIDFASQLHIKINVDVNMIRGAFEYEMYCFCVLCALTSHKVNDDFHEQHEVGWN